MLTPVGGFVKPWLEAMKRRMEAMEKIKERERPVTPEERRNPSDRATLKEQNEASLAGRLATDPKVRTVKNGDRMASFVLAVPTTYRLPGGRTIRETSFVPVLAWHGIAERCETLGKGNAVRIQGKLRTYKKQRVRYWQVKADFLEPVSR